MTLDVEEKAISDLMNNADSPQEIKLPDGKVIGPELGFTKLMVLLVDNNSSYRVAAMRALVTLRGEKVASMIIARLNDCAVIVRVEACKLLVELNYVKAVPKLFDSLNDRQPFVVCAAAKALIHFGDNSGYEAVVQCVLKKGAHQLYALECLNMYMEEKFPLNIKGLKSAIKMLSDSNKLNIFTIH